MFFDPGTGIEQCIRETLSSAEYSQLQGDGERARLIVAALIDAGHFDDEMRITRRGMRDRAMRAEFNGTNLRELSMRYGLSVRQTRRIVCR